MIIGLGFRWQEIGLTVDIGSLSEATFPAPAFSKEMAHGGCDTRYVSFGDRFIQLGRWRLAAINDQHFSISHNAGQTSEIHRHDGRFFTGPRTDYNAWDRPIGFPYGITFGVGFVQIGKFRLGMVDERHFSISHQSGFTSKIFRDDGTVYDGPRSDYDLWKVRSSGPAAGITSGDKFLQIGRFRLGDVHGHWLTLTHNSGSTSQVWKSDGTLQTGPGLDHWTPYVAHRHPKWHCGNIQQLA